MALPPLGTGKGRASSVKVIKQMLNVILDILPTCKSLREIIFATTSEKTFALFNNRVLADTALVRQEQALKDALPGMPPSLYGLVGDLLQRMEWARQAGDSPTELQKQAEGLIRVGEELKKRLPPSSGSEPDIAQLIIATGGSIVQNVTQQASGM